MKQTRTVVAAAFLVTISTAFAVNSQAADVPDQWEAVKHDYASCLKTGGQLPEFFESVKVRLVDGTVAFQPQTKEHGSFTLVYEPDGVVRRGTDYHYLEDGTVLPDMPAHEASFWEDDRLVREEVTYLPGNTFALETNTFSVGDDGTLFYELHIDGDLMLSATCR